MSKDKDAKQRPWCNQWALKGKFCNYIFTCGLNDHSNFHKGVGCGKSMPLSLSLATSSLFAYTTPHYCSSISAPSFSSDASCWKTSMSLLEIGQVSGGVDAMSCRRCSSTLGD